MSKGKKNRMRIGLIGYGTHGQWAVLPAMRAARWVHLAALADLNPKNLAKLADKNVACYTDYRQMLKREDLDAVYVATPVDAHCAVTLAALQAGCHVITEKPMAASTQQCRLMLAAARQAGKLLAVGFENRYIAAYQQIRRWIEAGYLGRLRAIHMDKMWDGHKIWGQLGTRRRRFCDSSGCLDCGIHSLDLARYFNGGGAWLSVKALGAWFGETTRFPPHISILATLEPGVLITFNASFALNAYIKKQIQAMDYSGLAILGDQGVLLQHQAADGAKQIELCSALSSQTIPLAIPPHSEAITSMLNDFAKAVLGKAPLPKEVATGLDGLMAQDCTLQANRQAVRFGDVGGGTRRSKKHRAPQN